MWPMAHEIGRWAWTVHSIAERGVTSDLCSVILKFDKKNSCKSLYYSGF